MALGIPDAGHPADGLTPDEVGVVLGLHVRHGADHLGACSAQFAHRNRHCLHYQLGLFALQQFDTIEKVRAACVPLGHLANSILAAIDGDQAVQHRVPMFSKAVGEEGTS